MKRPSHPWTRKGRFLRVLAKTANVALAARAAGIDKRTAYRWRDRDRDFARRWGDALERGFDVVRDELVERAVVGLMRPVRRPVGPTALQRRIKRFLDRQRGALSRIHSLDPSRTWPC
jgi:hypothetical protein